MRVLVQAGHWPDGGGAPGEAAWTWKLAGLLRSRLEAAGVACVVVGEWLNKPAPAAARQDYDLFVSLHYDAAIYQSNTGCFADRARADPLGAVSDRAIRDWEAVYPAATGIPLHNERRNVNTSNYYGFRDTSAATPGILIEHGVGQGLDHAVLFDGLERVADADARAILAFLGVTTQPIALEETGEDMATIAELEGIIREYETQVTALRQEIAGKDSELGALRNDVLLPLEEELASVKRELAECRTAAQTPPGVARVSLEATVQFTDGTRLLVPVAATSTGGT